MLGKLSTLWLALRWHWMKSLLTVSAVLLFTSAVGKTVTYGLFSSNAQAVWQRATKVPRGLARAAVLAELLVAVSLVAGRGSRRFCCSLLFFLCCCFVGYRVLNWGGGPCGCWVNPAMLNSMAAIALEYLAGASLIYMLVGSVFALLEPEPTHPKPAIA